MDNIDWATGIVQGCPMSPILFVITINYILRYIDETYKNDAGYEIAENVKILLTAFIDDIALITKDIESCKTIYYRLKELFSSIGLNFNGSKSGIMLVGNFTEEEKNGYQLDGIPIVTKYRYLGATVTSDGTHDLAFQQFLRLLSGKIAGIDRTDLATDFKVESFKNNVEPWIKRQMAIMYDLTLEEKARIVFVVRSYLVDRWGYNGYLELFSSVEDMVKDSSDEIIEKVKLEDYNKCSDVKYDSDLSKYKADGKMNFGYDQVKKDTKLMMKDEQINF